VVRCNELILAGGRDENPTENQVSGIRFGSPTVSRGWVHLQVNFSLGREGGNWETGPKKARNVLRNAWMLSSEPGPTAARSRTLCYQGQGPLQIPTVWSYSSTLCTALTQHPCPRHSFNVCAASTRFLTSNHLLRSIPLISKSVARGRINYWRILKFGPDVPDMWKQLRTLQESHNI
jgi:hypothetical protein